MNYTRIHEEFIEHFKNTTPKERLMKRDNTDIRLKENNIYVELHHIVPKSDGGEDVEWNLVELLPEEHIFIHFLRWKTNKHKGDIYAVNFMINGFLNKSCLNNITLNKIMRKTYSLHRREFGKIIRKANKGNKKLGLRLKNKMFAIDIETGEKVGLVPTDHENVISGKWVHQNTGRKKSEEELKVLRKRMEGLGNTTAYDISNDDYVKQTVEFIKRNNGVFVKKLYQEYCEKNNLPYLKSFSKFRFNGSPKEFFDQVEECCIKNNIPFQYKAKRKAK